MYRTATTSLGRGLLGAVSVCFFSGCMLPSTATLMLESEPTGARVFKNSTYIGTTPLRHSLGVIPASAFTGLMGGQWNPGAELTAHKHGYKEQTLHPVLNLEGVYRTGSHGRFDQDHCWRFVFLLDPEARRVAGAPVQQQQQQQQQQTVIVGRGAEAAGRGMVMVTSDVEDAEVYVDGMFAGNTPANLKLTEGIHVIEVRKAGLKPYKKELRVLGDSQLTLRAKLGK